MHCEDLSAVVEFVHFIFVRGGQRLTVLPPRDNNWGSARNVSILDLRIFYFSVPRNFGNESKVAEMFDAVDLREEGLDEFGRQDDLHVLKLRRG